MNRSIVIAGGIIVLLVAWFAWGMLGRGEEVAEGEIQAAADRRLEPTAVEVREVTAQPTARTIVVQGEVEPFRQVALRAELSGQVAEVQVRKGERVSEGQTIFTLAIEDRGARLREAQALVNQRQQDYEAVSQLLENGYTTRTRVREARAQLEQARAQLEQARSGVENSAVMAPFAGILNTLDVEPGEYVTAGNDVGGLLDTDPLEVTVPVPQQEILRVREGMPASVAFVTGQQVRGVISYVSAMSDVATRTFPVEVQVPNPANEIPAGISAEVTIPLERIMAHFLSPAVLSLGTSGELGLKAVGDDGTVAFYAVEIVRAESDGVWVSGAPETINLITVGQGFVRAGEEVRAVPAKAEDEQELTVRPGIASLANPEAPEDNDADAPVISPDADAPDIVEPEDIGQDVAAPAASGTDIAGEADLVRRIQSGLNHAGYDAGPEDGLIGETTRTAIRAYQRDHGLPVTGEPSPELLNRLDEAPS